MRTINSLSSVKNSTFIVLQSYEVKLLEGKYWKEKQIVKSKRKLKKPIF